MENNQDQAFNRIHILDDSGADDGQNGCAVFNGGINVNKNIQCCDLDTNMINAQNAKIYNTLSVQNNIYTDGDILPLTKYSSSSLGSNNQKWNSINGINANIQQLNVVNSTIKNSTIDNILLSSSITNINDNATNNITYSFCLDSVIVIINLVSEYDIDKIITMNIPNPMIGTKNNYHKIIFNQNISNNVKWSFNTNKNISSTKPNQIFDLINTDGIWKIIDYGQLTEENTDSIIELQTKDEQIDLSLCNINEKLDTLINYNQFLTDENTEDISLLDFINKNDELQSTVNVNKHNIETLNNTITALNTNLANAIISIDTNNTAVQSDIVDLSLNFNVIDCTIENLKILTNSTFQNINSLMIANDTKIASLSLRVSEITLESKRTREMTDIIDKRLCDFIHSNDSKQTFLNDKMTHINEKVNTVMKYLNLT